MLPEFSEQWLPAAVIGGAHGVRGALRVRGDEAQLLRRGLQVRLSSSHGVLLAAVIRCQPVPGGALVQVESINCRDTAGHWAGATLAVPATALPPLRTGEFYLHAIIGFAVIDEGGQDCGSIMRLDTNGPQTLLVLQAPAGGDERLLPAVPALIRQCDARHKRLHVRVPAGLWD